MVDECRLSLQQNSPFYSRASPSCPRWWLARPSWRFSWRSEVGALQSMPATPCGGRASSCLPGLPGFAEPTSPIGLHRQNTVSKKPAAGKPIPFSLKVLIIWTLNQTSRILAKQKYLYNCHYFQVCFLFLIQLSLYIRQWRKQRFCT